MLKEQHRSKPSPRAEVDAMSTKSPRVVTAKRPNHVWHVDLTTVPIGSGFWISWLPFALPQCWPFCWWLAVAVDHYSRRAMGVAVFCRQPKSADVSAFLSRTIRDAGAPPKYVICDKGVQFWCAGFKRWCQRRGIKPRFGAVGQHGSIAIVERFIRTLKECLARLPLVPTNRAAFRRELALIVGWYNESRPHSTLAGRTPNEVYRRRHPANRKPRFEPRANWPRGSPCAGAWALVRGKPGARLELDVTFVAGRRHLPAVTLRRAA
jgi:putative transposase